MRLNEQDKLGMYRTCVAMVYVSPAASAVSRSWEATTQLATIPTTFSQITVALISTVSSANGAC